MLIFTSVIISLLTIKFNIISANIDNNNVENNLLDDCKDNNEFNLTCQGARIMGNILKLIKNNNKPLILIPGLEIVASKDLMDNNLKFDGRSNSIDIEDSNQKTFSGRLNKYLRNHELKIKFSELFDKNDFKEVFLNMLEAKEVGRQLRRPDRGMHAVMLMGVMMAKMMTTLGFGSIGALAMKALGVSVLALLLSGLVGLKTLTGGHHEDTSHHVQYITHDGHHRIRREENNKNIKNLQLDIPLPFRAWSQNNI